MEAAPAVAAVEGGEAAAEAPQAAAAAAAAAAPEAAQAAAAEEQAAPLFKRTVALHTGYVGTAYRGSSVNRTLGEAATVEQVLEDAIFKAGLMLETNYMLTSRTRWSRASRTDKGVHSLGTVMGLRMLVDERGYVDGTDTEGGAMAGRINAQLPADVRVFAVQKVNKRFDARDMCASRTYEYYLPAVLLGLDGSGRDAATLAALRAALQLFVGYHPFHNFTKPSKEKGKGDGRDKKKRAVEGKEANQGGRAAGTEAGKGAKCGAATPAVPAAACGRTGDEGEAAAAPEAEGEAEGAAAGAAEGAAGAAAACAGQGQGGAGGDRRGAAQRGGARGRKRGRDAGGGGDEGGGDDEEEGGELDEEEGDEEGYAAFMAQGAASTGGATAAAAAQEGPSSSQGGPSSGGGGGGGGGSAVQCVRRVPRWARPQLRFNMEVDPRDIIQKTCYRTILSFTAEDPRPLVEGGTPCLLLRVHGQSFMLHHIRHMIGAAVAVARGLMPMALLEGALTAPSRVTLPIAPPHTLLLADCDFMHFPHQHGTGDNNLVAITGASLSLRAQGQARKEAFREQMLLPALQQLVELPEWGQWVAALEANYPFPADAQDRFIQQHTAWAAQMAAKRSAKAETWQHGKNAGRGGTGGPRGGGGRGQHGGRRGNNRAGR